MTQSISVDPNLQGTAAKQRWVTISNLLAQLQTAVNNSVTYNVPAAPGGGNVSAQTLTATTLNISGNETVGGGISVAGQVAANTITANPGSISAVGGIATYNGQGAFHLFIGTVDPGSSANEGDIWVDG